MNAMQAAFVFVAALSVALIALTIAPEAAACPNCAVGKQARSEVWNGEFGFNLAVVALPFLLIGGLCLRVDSLGRRRPAPNEADAPAIERPANHASPTAPIHRA